jgi:predicted RNase H-related nuclease YkuK (DUF458 family)
MELNWMRVKESIKVPIIEYLENLIKEELSLGHKLTIAVGTDSQTETRGYKFATVILVTVKKDMGGGLTKGLGGKVMHATYRLPTYARHKAGVNERMLIEVGKSIEVANEIAPLLDKYKIKLELHADINPDPRWESNKAMSAAIGWILGMGYDFKIKPLAFAASFSADKYCH